MTHSYKNNTTMIKTRLQYLFSLFLLTTILASCESSTEPPTTNSKVEKPALLVLNEGRFTASNASLDAILLAAETRLENILPNLGDVGSDVAIINEAIYVLSSASKKLYVVSPVTGEKLSTLNFESTANPNAIAQISSTQALITDLYAPGIRILDLTADTVIGMIETTGGTVDIAVSGNRAYVTAATNSLYVINTDTRSIIETVDVGDVPQSVIVDESRGKVIVHSWGQFSPVMTPGEITEVDITTLEATRRIEIPTDLYVKTIILGGQKLFAITSNGVRVIELTTGQLPNSGVVTDEFNGGVFDASSNELYLGKGGYSEEGKVEVRDATTFELKRSYNAGIAPTRFAFYR